MTRTLCALLLACVFTSSALAIQATLDKRFPGLEFPASFEGTLPCADCAGIETRINLWDDGVFHMQQTYLETADGDTSFISLGRWHVDPIAKNKIYLHGNKEAPAIFILTEDGALQKLDTQGQPIDSSLSYFLSPIVFTPIKIETGMTGEFRYLADAAIFTECHTQRTYPVAMNKDYAALEQAYMKNDKPEPGSPVVISIEGELAPHPSMEESQGDVETLFVNHFIGIADGLTCERALSQANLVNTYWKIKSLDGHDIVPVKEGREAHIILQDTGTTKTIAATMGCNQMRGRYQLDGYNITFDPNGMAMTLMACPPPLDQLEKTLAETLKNTTRWRIESQLLEFFDSQDNSVAVFEAVYLP